MFHSPGEMTTSAVLGFSGMVLLLLWILKGKNRNSYCEKKVAQLPQPRGYPVAGNAPQLGLTTLHLDLTTLAKSIGEVFQVKLFTRKMVVANTVDTIREALVGHDSDWAGRLQSYRGYLSTRHCSLFMTSDLEYLRMMKRKASNGLAVYNGSRVSTMEVLSMNVVEEFLDDTLAKVGNAFDLRGDVDLLVRRLAATLLCGKYISKDSRLPDLLGSYGLCLKKVLALTPSGLVLDNFPLSRFLGNSAYTTITRAVEIREHIWHKHLKPLLEAGEASDGFVGLMGQALGQRYGRKARVIQDSHIENIVGDVAFGGTITSSDSLYAFLNVLCEFPDVQQRMAKEISSIGKKNEKLDKEKRLPSEQLVTATDKTKLPFCRAVLLEMFRFTSVVPFVVPRRALRSTEIHGKEVPEGYGMLANIWAANHDPALWQDPYQFKAERFLDDEGLLVPAGHKHRRSLFTFGAGTRSCPGQNMAMDNLFVVLTNLVQRFRLSFSDNDVAGGGRSDPCMWPLMGITLQAPSFNVRLQLRENV